MQNLTMGTTVKIIKTGMTGSIAGRREGRKPILVFRRDGFSQFVEAEELEEAKE